MKTEYELSKHRYYELKHFCLQYPDWKRAYVEADGWSGEGDTTSRDGIKRGDLKRYIELVESCAYETDRSFAEDLLRLVTGQDTCVKMEAFMMYYYRKFFWLLSRKR